MLLSKKALSVVGAAPLPKDNRDSLLGIYVEADGSTVGCDGHILVKFTPARTAKEKIAEEKEFPVVDSIKAVDTEALKPCLLPLSMVKEAIQSIRSKKSHVFSVCNNVVLDVSETNKGKRALLSILDGDSVKSFSGEKGENYPDYRKVIPDFSKPDVESKSKGKSKGKGKRKSDKSAPKTFKIGFTVAVLQKLLATLASMDAKIVQFEMKDDLAPALVTCPNDEEMLAVIMPCRT